MSNKLIDDIKKLIVELKDEEEEAKKLERERPDNAAYFQGLSIGRMSARVSLECLIEEHGHHRPSCVESELRMRLGSAVDGLCLGISAKGPALP